MSPAAYHLLAAGPEPFGFARAVRTAVDGFVSHDAYTLHATAAAQRGEAAASLARHVAVSAALDANPIADLLLTAPDAAAFATRWNGFNRDASLGVRTFIDSDGLRRESRGADSIFRAELIAELIPRLTRCRRVDARRRLSTIYDKDDAVSDLLEALYASPWLDLNETATSLGCSRRSLQRALVHVGLAFRVVRQAVRVTLAGHRLRQPGHTLTDIAYDCGFFDSAHLVRAWRRACAMAPSAYRELVVGRAIAMSLPTQVPARADRRSF